MPNWDEYSPQLAKNLKRLMTKVKSLSTSRKSLKANIALDWHKIMMKGLTADHPDLIGNFRGPPKLIGVEVRIGPHYGVISADIPEALQTFEKELNKLLAMLDKGIPKDDVANPTQIQAVITACAWIHAEWVRIHPLGNGNGRTARLWANLIAMRYNLPPFIVLRPRPNGDYASAGHSAMQGDYHPTIKVFNDLFVEFLNQQ